MKKKYIAILKFILYLITGFFISIFCIFIFWVFIVAPRASKGTNIPMSVHIGCKSDKYIEKLLTIKGFKADIFPVFRFSAQRVYEKYISNRSKTADGYGLIGELFSMYGLFGAECDQEIYSWTDMYLKRGAGIDDPGDTGRPATVGVIVDGSAEGLNFLLKHGANVCYEWKTKDGKDRNLLILAERLYKNKGDKYLEVLKIVKHEYEFSCKAKPKQEI